MTRDEKTWWLVIERSGVIGQSASITVSGRELLMNSEPEAKTELLGARFDEAVRKLREWFLENA